MKKMIKREQAKVDDAECDDDNNDDSEDEGKNSMSSSYMKAM